MEVVNPFTDEQERQKLFAYLNELEIEYHKPTSALIRRSKYPAARPPSHYTTIYTTTTRWVDACATLSFALHYFAGGFWGHYVSRCDNDLGAVL